MPGILRLASLSTAAALVLSVPGAGQQEVKPAADGCAVMCAATAVACSAVMIQMGGSPEFCLGLAAGCVEGCNM